MNPWRTKRGDPPRPPAGCRDAWPRL